MVKVAGPYDVLSFGDICFPSNMQLAISEAY
jgi:hypothetical protein